MLYNGVVIDYLHQGFSIVDLSLVKEEGSELCRAGCDAISFKVMMGGS
jgi:hypothetical protein